MRRMVSIMTLLAVLFSMTACGSKKESPKAASAAVTEEKSKISAYGTVKPQYIENINIDFPAIIEKVHVKDGQKVKQGDVIYTLNISEYLAKIKNQEIGLATERKDIHRQKNNDPNISKLYNDLANAEDLYKKALEDFDKKKQLLDQGAISQSEFDEFDKFVDAKKKAVDDAKYAINILGYTKDTSIDSKASNADTMGNDLAVMKDKLNKSYIQGNTIVANVKKGVVYDLAYDHGEVVDQKRKALSMLDLDSITVEASIAEEFIKDVKHDKEVEIIPVADKSKSYKGKVIRISNKTIQKNGETDIVVEISIDNKDQFLLPGMNVDVFIDR
ncbi:MAG: efflux RND transporter periplasmic adaptor subunit [Clostridia bacterium]|nr:efflux RND transporter periplasmic adaptor subunit [Clostridia bacterium]